MGFREKYAGKFGKIEHQAGRLIAIPIIATIILIFLGEYRFALYTSIIVAVYWIIYLVSHSIEKKLYGPGLRR